MNYKPVHLSDWSDGSHLTCQTPQLPRAVTVNPTGWMSPGLGLGQRSHPLTALCIRALVPLSAPTPGLFQAG